MFRVRVLFWISGVLGMAASVCAGTFTNPIVANGADPWVTYRNGYYYFTDTTGVNVQISISTQMAGTNGIGAVPVSLIYNPPAPFNQDVWAPEIHYLQGKFYIYYAADDGTNADHRVFVAEQQTGTMSFAY